MHTAVESQQRSPRVDVAPAAELAILARALYRDGYNEHNNGHISAKQPDGTLLVTPRGLAWDELKATDIVRIDTTGSILDGVWDISPALRLHLVLHHMRDTTVAVHHHPEWATVWACTGTVPPVYDQMSAYLGGPLASVDEYAGEVFDDSSATATVREMGDSHAALLANHGVLVLGDSVRQAHQRAVALEWRCRLAWRVEALGSGRKALTTSQVEQLEKSINDRGGYLPFLFDSMARKEIRIDSSVLD